MLFHFCKIFLRKLVRCVNYNDVDCCVPPLILSSTFHISKKWFVLKIKPPFYFAPKFVWTSQVTQKCCQVPISSTWIGNYNIFNIFNTYVARYKAENDQMCFLCFMSFCVFFFIAILFNRFVFYVFLCFFLSNLPRLFVRFVVTLCWREKKHKNTLPHVVFLCFSL